MNILIYGGGSVGLGLATCLLKSGQSCTIVARESTCEALRQGGIIREGIFGRFEAPPSAFACYTTLGEIPTGPFDVACVATKSFDSEAAAEDLAAHAERLGIDTLLLCQNGYGNYEVFRRFFPKQAVFNARVITGFCRPRPNESRITVHAAPVHVGHLEGISAEKLVPFCEAVAAGDLPCRMVEDVGKDLWAKILYNGLLNPLGAIFQVPYGRLGESPHTRFLMRLLAEETFAVMKAVAASTHRNDAGAYLEAFYGSMLPPTADHESSMLQDLRAGRRTEIDALNGAVVRLGEEQGVDTPVNRTVVEQIGFLEERKNKDEG